MIALSLFLSAQSICPCVCTKGTFIVFRCSATNHLQSSLSFFSFRGRVESDDLEHVMPGVKDSSAQGGATTPCTTTVTVTHVDDMSQSTDSNTPGGLSTPDVSSRRSNSLYNPRTSMNSETSTRQSDRNVPHNSVSYDRTDSLESLGSSFSGG